MKAFLLCDSVTKGVGGKFNLHGIFDSLLLNSGESDHGPFCLYYNVDFNDCYHAKPSSKIDFSIIMNETKLVDGIITVADNRKEEGFISFKTANFTLGPNLIELVLNGEVMAVLPLEVRALAAETKESKLAAG